MMHLLQHTNSTVNVDAATGMEGSMTQEQLSRRVGVTRWVACLVLLLVWLPLAHAEDLACHKDEQISDGGRQAVRLALIADKKQQIVGLIFEKSESYVDKGNPLAFWSCSIDTTHLDSDHRIRWLRKGKMTTVEIMENNTGDISRIRIETQGKGYLVIFEEMSRYYSGMTPFPASVLLERGRQECTVVSR